MKKLFVILKRGLFPICLMIFMMIYSASFICIFASLFTQKWVLYFSISFITFIFLTMVSYGLMEDESFRNKYMN